MKSTFDELLYSSCLICFKRTRKKTPERKLTLTKITITEVRRGESERVCVTWSESLSPTVSRKVCASDTAAISLSVCLSLSHTHTHTHTETSHLIAALWQTTPESSSSAVPLFLCLVLHIHAFSFVCSHFCTICQCCVLLR